MKRVTLQDVATFTGYSHMAVSSAITGRGRLGDDARKEILAAAKKLGYVPDLSARGLRLGKSSLVALVTNGAVANLAGWVKEIQKTQSLAVVIFDEARDQTFSRLSSCHADGAIWFGPVPKNPPLRVVSSKLGPRAALEQLLKE